MQALSEGQSMFVKHSGLQLGGDPIILCVQAHLQMFPTTLGISEFGPHGFGSHGSAGSVGLTASKEYF